MKTNNLLVATVAGLFLSGCTTINVTKTGKGFFPPISPSEVEIRGTLPKENYIEVGMVSANIFGSPETGYNEIRKKAGALGADVVVIGNQTPIDVNRFLLTGVALKMNSK